MNGRQRVLCGSMRSRTCSTHVRITEARGGGGLGTPGDSGSTWLARGRPGVGAHLVGAGPGVDPHCPGRGSTRFLRRRLLFKVCIDIDPSTIAAPLRCLSS